MQPRVRVAVESANQVSCQNAGGGFSEDYFQSEFRNVKFGDQVACRAFALFRLRRLSRLMFDQDRGM
jgi:hypothetical protein